VVGGGADACVITGVTRLCLLATFLCFFGFGACLCVVVEAVVVVDTDDVVTPGALGLLATGVLLLPHPATAIATATAAIKARPMATPSPQAGSECRLHQLEHTIEPEVVLVTTPTQGILHRP